MAKNIIQDVIAKNRRSIRQISIDKVKTKHPVRDETRKIMMRDKGERERETETAGAEEYGDDGRKNLSKMIIWIIAASSVIFLLFSVSSYFGTATVTIAPKIVSILFDDIYTVKKNAFTGELQYEMMTLQKKMSKQLEATETENLEVKASGKIVVYNNFSSATQRLIKNTRFESKEGLIYKIPESIVIPGKKLINGKEVSGSVETIVFADEPGSKYNMKISDLKGDFKIAGFKGDKKYDYFYARIKSDIIGGTSGLIKKVSAKTSDETIVELRTKLKEELLKEAYSAKPETSVLLDNAYYLDYASLPDSDLGDNKIEISERATFYGVIFDKAKLSSFVANKKIPDYDGAPVNLVLRDDATVGISDDSKTKKPWESDILNLSLKGSADIVWAYDKTVLQKSLAGYRKDNLKSFFSSYPGIKASVEIRPFWKRYLPSNPGKIKIKDSVSKN